MKLQFKDLKDRYKKTLLKLYKKISRAFKTRNLRENYHYNSKVAKNNFDLYSKQTYSFIKRRSFVSFVIIPTAIVALYYILLASPRYESQALVSLKQNNPMQIAENPMSAMLGGAASPTIQESYLLINYIQSAQMLNNLQTHLNLKQHYQNSSVDFISRLSKSADNLDFLKYFNKMVSLEYNIQSNAITINVQAYTADQAKKTLDEIITKSQASVDNISHTLAQNKMRFSQIQLKEIKQKALSAQNKLVEYQNKRGILDPESSMTSKTTLIGELKGQLAASETQLTNLKSYMNPGASEIKAIEQQIVALKTQINKERDEFLKENPNSDKSELDDLISNYPWLKLNAEFAMNEYQSALQSFETAKLQNQSQQIYLVDVVQPTLPDTAKYPRVLYNLLTIFIILSALYGLGRMIITIIIENR